MKVGKACGLGVQFVQIRSLQEGVPVTAEIPISLVVGHDQDDVGFASLERFASRYSRHGSTHKQRLEGQ